MNRRHQAAVYDYVDENGDLLYQKVRYEPKDFRQRRHAPDDPAAERGGYVWNLNGTRRVLYRLPEVIDAVAAGFVVYVTEGEKDADAIAALRECATTNTEPKSWLPEYSETLRGAVVVIVRDRDASGHDRSRLVYDALVGVADSVAVVEPAEGKDAYDHLHAGFTLEDFVDVEIDELPAALQTDVFERALEKSSEVGRNEACMWLVHQCRDNRYREDESREMVRKYQLAVDGEGDHSFPLTEAMRVFDKHFFTEPRSPSRLDNSTPLTDYGNAERLVARHGEAIRYCPPWQSWLVWNGTRWVRDDAEVERRAKDTIRSLYRSAANELDEDKRQALAKWARQSESANRLRAAMLLAKTEAAVEVQVEAFDAYPMLLNVENGIVELTTGKLLAHSPHLMLTKLAPVEYDPTAVAPLWEKFLRRVLPDAGDRTFVQRAVGYSLTGDISEHAMFVLHGSGANGKTVFQETIRAALGDYAQQASSELILARRPGTIPTDVARLRGARLVSASETEDGDRLAESQVKQITGGDRIVARQLYQDPFEFGPTHKLWLSTNHKPTVHGTDDAIWRRLRLIPFEQTIPPKQRDKHLTEKLRRELPGILQWAVEGCLAWQRDGLGESEHVRRATADYRKESDVFGQFLEECCVLGPNESVPASVLFLEYEAWASAAKLRPMSKPAFGRKMRDRKFHQERRGHSNVTTWVGVAVPGRTEKGKLRVVGGGSK